MSQDSGGSQDEPKRLLFLFSETGAGHRSAAEAVAVAIDRLSPGQYSVEMFDPLRRERGRLVGRLTALYGPVTRRAPQLWGAAYHATNFSPMVSLVQHTLGRGLRPRMRRALRNGPALVASFHPLLNHVALDCIGPSVPLVTVITDWIEFHEAWTDSRASRIVCPSEQALELCLRRGVLRERLVLTGLPIHPRFNDALDRYPDRRTVRAALGLRPYARTVLVAGGGDGTEPLNAYARALAGLPLDLQVLVVCGRNASMARQIRRENHVGVSVFGFVDNMAELMLASDLLVTRAGPGMIGEGLACGCPLFLTGYLPGQEAANVREVKRRGLGQYVPTPEELANAVASWFARPAEERRQDQERARTAGDPMAAFNTASSMLSLLA
jgi:1,2-diacylglycerol 3-beta-galactosyltransferase